MKALRLPARAIPVAYWFASEHHAIPPVFVLAAWRSQIGGGPARARALVQPAAQSAGSLSRGHERDLSEAFIAYFNRTLAKPFKWTMTGKPPAA